MSHENFKPDDIFINRIKAYPELNFFIYDSQVIINGHKNLSGSNAMALNVAAGHRSLHELNINRAGSVGFVNSTDPRTGSLGYVFPWVKNEGTTAKYTFRNSIRNAVLGSRPESTICSANVQGAYLAVPVGDPELGSMPMSASITRILETGTTTFTGYGYHCGYDETSRNINKHVSALQNTATKYTTLSKHFCFKGTPYTGSLGTKILERDLTTLDTGVNIIDIPSIFYGSALKKGSVKLKYYITGTLVGEASDYKLNGELVETIGSATGTTIGVVMYDEGIMLLTASHPLSTAPKIQYGTSGDKDSSWIYFGTGCNDGNKSSETGPADHFSSASFNISCKGTSYVNTMTLFCHARTGKYTYSNNPTFIDITSAGSKVSSYETSSFTYKESALPLKGVVSSSFTNYSSSYEKISYLSKIGVYDKKGNLIMIASMAKPIKKTDQDEYTFKLTLDI